MDERLTDRLMLTVTVGVAGAGQHIEDGQQVHEEDVPALEENEDR